MSLESTAPDPRPLRLSASETTELAGQIAALAQAGLPLAPGLRAASEELRGGRLARAFARLAKELERGVTLEAALAAQGRSFPAHLRHLVPATVQSGRLARLLEHVVSTERRGSELRQRLWTNLAYPTFLVLIVFFLMGFLVHWVVPQVTQSTVALASIVNGRFADPTSPLEIALTAKFVFWTMAIFLSLGLLLWTASHLGATRVWNHVLQAIPLLGPLVRWSRVARFARLMEILLEEQTPLPESFRLTAVTLGDPDMMAACREAASRVEAGLPLAESLADLRQFPPTLLSFLAWGDSQGSLAAAFRGAAEAFEERLESQVELVEGLLPTLMMLLVAGILVMMFGSLMTNVFGQFKGLM